MLHKTDEKPASNLARVACWYPENPEIDSVIRAWDAIHPASYTHLREAVDKYLGLLQSGASAEDIKAAKEYQDAWWVEYWKDMKKGITETKNILRK